LLFQVTFDRLPDIVELLRDERRRQLELVALVERIEQLALETIAGRAGMLARNPVLHGVAQLGQRLHAELFGEIVVDGELARRIDRLRGYVEGCFLSGKLRLEIVRRE